jgi:hypothetical protein
MIERDQQFTVADWDGSGHLTKLSAIEMIRFTS